MRIDKTLFLKYANFIKENGGVFMFENLTPDGKIKTIRYNARSNIVMMKPI